MAVSLNMPGLSWSFIYFFVCLWCVCVLISMVLILLFFALLFLGILWRLDIWGHPFLLIFSVSTTHPILIATFVCFHTQSWEWWLTFHLPHANIEQPMLFFTLWNAFFEVYEETVHVFWFCFCALRWDFFLSALMHSASIASKPCLFLWYKWFHCFV